MISNIRIIFNFISVESSFLIVEIFVISITILRIVKYFKGSDSGSNPGDFKYLQNGDSGSNHFKCFKMETQV